jgi:hypothetical protein
MKVSVGRDIGSVLFHNCNDACMQCLYKFFDSTQTTSQTLKCNGQTVRRGIMEQRDTVVRICSDEVDDVHSSRLFRQKFTACFSMIDLLRNRGAELREDFQRQREVLLRRDAELRDALKLEHEKNKDAIGKIITRLSHNLVSLNTRSSQELFALVPQERLTGNIHNQLTTISGILSHDLRNASSVYLRLIKNCLAMDAEFIAARSTCSAIITGEQRVTNPKRHPLRKVILNVAHAFLMDFKEHDIDVEFCEYKGNALFDYSTFRCSLFHIFDNATKYAMPSTTVTIDIVEDKGFINVRFAMRSLPILLDEIDAICSDGISGRMPTAYGLNGHGHGLFITKELLSMNNAVFKIYPNITSRGRYRHANGREYEDNLFEIQMAK